METYVIIIWSFFAGVCFASLYAYYVKHMIGSPIRYLLENKCLSAESAKELSFDGVLGGLTKKLVLRKGSAIYETVSFCDSGCYIPKEKAEKAKKKYKGDMKFYQVIAAIAAFLVIALLCVKFYPKLYNYIMDFVNSL